MKRPTKQSKQERLEAIRARMENTDVGGNQAGWFNLKEGVNKLRIMPEVGEMEPGAFYQEVGVHYLPDGKDKTKRVYCPSFTTNGDEDCPICEVVEQLYRGNAKDKEDAGKLRVRKSYWMNVIDRNNETAGPLLMSAGVTIVRALFAAINDPDYGDITDPYDGLDVTIERKGSSLDTEYQVRFARLATPLAGTSKEPDEDTMDEWYDAAKDLSVVILSDDPDEDKKLSAGHVVYVLPYERLASEYDLTSLLDSEEDVDEEDDEDEEVAAPAQHEAQREVSQRRARRASRR